MSVRFSILICHLPSRRDLLARLMSRLEPQLTPEVEVLVEEDDGRIPIGLKRNRLMDRAAGSYLSYCDDDDLVSDDYILRILSAIESSPDCVGFRSQRFCDGKQIGTCLYSITAKTEQEGYLPDGQRKFLRTPMHINPIRREHVLATRFLPLSFSEDRDFARRILPRLKTEVFIDEFLYDYLLVTRDKRVGEPQTRKRWQYAGAR